jgi:[lysine-biosynthesis-protein LysW]---L-2-aminoadipate ligase
VNRQPKPGLVAVLASQVRADERRILDALDRRSTPYTQVDTRDSWGYAGGPDPGWAVALNREIGQTRAYYAASVLESRGTRVVNTASAVEICGDKWRMTLALRRAGLPTPRTCLALTPAAALAAMDAMGYPAVIKPLNGSWGRLVTPVPDHATAQSILEYVAALPSPQSHIVYVQELVQKPDRDIRVLVVGGEVLGATYRSGREWRTNVARGAVSSRCELTPDITKLAATSALAVGADIAGVDLIEDRDGVLSVLEVNQRVEFSGFQEAHEGRIDVADRIVDCLLAEAGSCPA